MTPRDPMDGVALLSTVRYCDLALGDRWGPFSEAVMEEDHEKLGDGVLALVTLRALRRALDGIPPGGVLTRQHFAVHAGLTPGEHTAIEVVVTDRHRGSRGLSTTFTFALRQPESLAAVVEWTILEAPE